MAALRQMFKQQGGGHPAGSDSDEEDDDEEDDDDNDVHTCHAASDPPCHVLNARSCVWYTLHKRGIAPVHVTTTAPLHQRMPQ